MASLTRLISHGLSYGHLSTNAQVKLVRIPFRSADLTPYIVYKTICFSELHFFYCLESHIYKGLPY